MTRKLILLPAALLAWAALAAEPAGYVTKPKGAINFSEHIAPIVFNQCATCHRPGEAAPFNLTSYQDVAKRGRLIAAVTQARYMPPWHAEPTHYRFANERRLTGEQIGMLNQWVEEGMPHGDPAKQPELPKFAEGWELGEPDHVASMGRAFQVPAEGPDIYRYFVLPLNLDRDRWVRALQFRPGARSVVHHALVYVDPSGEWRTKESADGQPGLDSRRRGPDDKLRIATWAVGTDARALPDGAWIKVPKGSDLVIQTHFHPSGKVEEEVSSVGLYFAERPATRSIIEIHVPHFFGEISGIDIPAGAPDYTLEESFVTPVDVEAFAAFPHAHYLGKEFRMIAELPGGETRDLLWVKRWDFAWQSLYLYEKPFVLPEGTRITTKIVWDNTAENPHNPFHPPQRVKWGPFSEDEMGSIILDVMPVRESDLPALQAALNRHFELARMNLLLSAEDALAKGAGPYPDREKKIAQAALDQFDKNRDGKLSPEELEAARAWLRGQGFDEGLRRYRGVQVAAGGR